jgi:hypothetical protein
MEKETIAMNNALTTSENPITDGQQNLIIRLVEDAHKRALRALWIVSPDSPAAQRIITRGNELQDAIIDKMRELSLELPEMPCFGIADWQKFYGIVLAPKQIASVANFPWSDKTLNTPCPFNPGKMVRETHFAFVGLDTVSIMELQKLNPKEATELRFYAYGSDSWYRNEEFATTVKLKFRWYLLLKDIVPGSENRTFDEQKAMLSKEYEVPTALQEVAKDFLIFKKTGTYVNSNRYARTANLNSDGCRVFVGGCDAGGVHVDFHWGIHRRDDVGLSASRKFE